MTMNACKEHPVIEAIKLKKKAIRLKAHPKVISNLESRLRNEASKSINILNKSKYICEQIGIRYNEDSNE